MMAPAPAAWIAARARNALRRPFFIAAVSIVTFATALMALVIVPQQARKTAAAMRPAVVSRPDTEPTAAAAREAARQVASADSALMASKAELASLVAATAAVVATDTTASGDTVSRLFRSRRDSVAAQVATLTRLMGRAENAPLLSSYRTLAQSEPMQADPIVRPLLDSLVALERERESYNAVGGVDPVFVALTARANELGRNIVALANTRRTVLRETLAALGPAAPELPAALAARPLPDTVARANERLAAYEAQANVNVRLGRERAELALYEEKNDRARELANVGASPSAMLAAALVFGAMLGFGVALFMEVRRPRIADAFEVERATGVRVLGTIRPLPAPVDQTRRTADRAPTPYIDPGSDGHQLIYLTIATAGLDTVMLTVTGDSPAVAAVVAINFAAIAADEARATLLIDTDGAGSPVASALRLRSSAGLAALAAGRASWHDATREARLGRDRTIEVVAAGSGVTELDSLRGLLQRDIEQLANRYDALVLVSTPEQVLGGLPTALPIPDVLYCVRSGETELATLTHDLAAITESGANVRGIVIWNAPDPVLSELRPVEESEREAAAVG